MSSKKGKGKFQNTENQKGTEDKTLLNMGLHFLNEILKAFHLETISSAGRVNIIFDLALLAIFIVYLLSNTVTSVTRIVASIFNPSLTRQTGDNVIVLAFIFIGASVGCLVFMHITRKEKEYYNQYIEDSKDS